ncbi:flagellar cap protein [Robertmurraya yapensis]|uniref:Flagellar hook-associated protein 2 n=1 Tax=Bacillus yapensis TaxID=2492960 RepID=A0A3S0KRV7_9BACI|nr:flagellar filament capping protein FliD [Bacillus yapensis]RTR36361.1 flagellar cap protein [Bacillus yapensis]TKT05865.1 flagellar cap protein [Bacillus yapensis]
MANNTMRITGFASGLDTDQIIKDLMNVERAPLDKLFQKKEWLQWQQDAYRDVNLELSTFQAKADKLRFSTAFNGYKATSTNTSFVSVSSKSNAVQGSYDLTINKLAETARVKTDKSILGVDGSAVKSTNKVLTSGETAAFEVKTSVGTATITVTDQDTYATLASKIGAATTSDGKSLGLRASFDEVTSSFVISTKEMGENQSITLTSSDSKNIAALINKGGSLADASSVVTNTYSAQGQNAEIIFDGTTISNLTSNKATIYGIELTLLKADPNMATTVNVESDTESIFNNIKDYIDSYNSLIDSLTTKVKTTRDRDYSPLTDTQREELSEKEAEKWDEKAKQGLLYNDEIIRTALTNLRGDMGNIVSGIPSGQIKMLSQLGISTKYMATDGKLEIDEDKLKAAIANNPDEVAKLFTAEDGIATRVYDELSKTVDKLNKKAGRPNTAANIDSSSLGSSINDITKQMADWEDKLETIEDRYYKQFTAMEKAISDMNSQSSSITSMLG